MKIIKINNITIFFLLTSLLCGFIKETIIIFFIILFHELGHCFIIKLLKYKIVSIDIYPFGGITKIEKKLNDYIINDLLIAVFGILFQLLLFFIDNPIVYKYNIAIILFNLLPIIPLDGSKIVFEILNLFLPYKKTIYVYFFISLFFIILYGFFNYCFIFNNYLIIILFLYKTIEVYKKRKILFNRFILERYLYEINFSKIVNKNESIYNYQKDTKYYYSINNNVYDEKAYLKTIFH